jgi:hypothetical protein
MVEKLRIPSMRLVLRLSESSSVNRVLLPLAAASVVFSLGLRLAHRGPYYPGWEVLGAAQGLYLISTKTPWEILRFYIDYHYHPTHLWNVYGIPSVLVPGYLASLWPWEYWSHVVTFAAFLLMLWLILKAVDLRLVESWIILLAWGASSALVSFSITGIPFVTSFLPHALALWVVLNSRLRQHWLWTLLLCLVANELSWHVYDLGRTVFIVFLAAALLLRDVPWKTRGVWFLAFVLQLRDVLIHPNYRTAYFTQVPMLGIGEIAQRILGIGTRLFIEPWIDLPIVFVAGVASAILLTRNRWFFRGLFAFQVLLIIALAMKDVGYVWPQRFLVVDFYCLVAIAALYRELRSASARHVAKVALVSLLLVGNLWQIVDTIQFSRGPLDRQDKGWDFTMPFAHTTIDYMVPFVDVDWYRELRSRADAGNRLLLVYNLSSYEENHTNPTGILERLYLHLGHARFTSSVFAFGSMPCRWNCLPIRPMEELEKAVNGISEPSSFAGYYLTHPLDPQVYRREATMILDMIGKRFQIEAEPEWQGRASGLRFLRFKIRPLNGKEGSPTAAAPRLLSCLL